VCSPVISPAAAHIPALSNAHGAERLFLALYAARPAGQIQHMQPSAARGARTQNPGARGVCPYTPVAAAHRSFYILRATATGNAEHEQCYCSRYGC
jgi:hypothetical protein